MNLLVPGVQDPLSPQVCRNDERNGDMINALTNEGGTAFSWDDIKHNKEGLELYKSWNNEKERIRKENMTTWQIWMENISTKGFID